MIASRLHRDAARPEPRQLQRRSSAGLKEVGKEALEHLAQASPRLTILFGAPTCRRRPVRSEGSHRLLPAGGRACAAGLRSPALAGGAPIAVLLHAAKVCARRDRVTRTIARSIP